MGRGLFCKKNILGWGWFKGAYSEMGAYSMIYGQQGLFSYDYYYISLKIINKLAVLSRPLVDYHRVDKLRGGFIPDAKVEIARVGSSGNNMARCDVVSYRKNYFPDIDECKKNASICKVFSTCFNTAGSYYCSRKPKCGEGYELSGSNCVGKTQCQNRLKDNFFFHFLQHWISDFISLHIFFCFFFPIHFIMSAYNLAVLILCHVFSLLLSLWW